MKRERRSTKNPSLSIAKNLRVETLVEVPEDVVADILLHLPAKSLIRFRSVCKAWCDLIKSPSFIAEHSRNKRNDLIVLRPFGEDRCVLSSFSTESVIGATLRYDLEMPSSISRFSSCLLGPCNGIVCISNFRATAMYLCNPSLILPPSQFVSSTTGNVGFGFDPFTDDYKVIRISEYICEGEDFRFAPTIRRVEIYNLSSDSWREIDYPFPFRAGGYSNCVGKLVEDVCHWCAKSETQDAIVSFHMSEDVFRVIGWGPIGENKRGIRRSLVVLDGCLGVILDYIESGSVVIYEIRVMKK